MFADYVHTLAQAIGGAIVSDSAGNDVPLEKAVERIGTSMRGAQDRGNKVLFIGNGGSAGICSHMAIDCSKNGGMRALSLNDGAALTCLGNDYGYEDVFSKQIEWHARAGDILIAISSSGSSANILNGVAEARNKGCEIYTLSGFGPDNPLRSLGDLNIYVASREYGFVEVGHLAILHGVLDIQMGWVNGDGVRAVQRSGTGE